MSIEKSCRQCQNQFSVTEEDLVFYEKISPVIQEKKYLIPAPVLCPECRQQRRLSFRNERKLYERKCDLTQKEIISTFSPDKPFKVYEQSEWWSDKWDPLNYGREFDFSLPFFEQMYELSIAVPKIALMVDTSQNCRHTNFVLDCKNCYMVLGWGSHCEDCYYGSVVESCKNCVDNNFTFGSELCYECVNANQCYHCTYITSCSNCSDCHFSENCVACKNCIGCLNLTNQEFHIFNQAYSKDEYLLKAKELLTYSDSSVQEIKDNLQKLKAQIPQKYFHGTGIENATGDYLNFSKNIHHGFDVGASEDLRYSTDCFQVKDSIDCCKVSNAAFLRECISFTGQNCSFINLSWYCHDLYYCQECFNNCSDCFGCIGLKHKQYCILNKQYTKKQYEALLPKIIEHMQSTDEWGQFFPAQHSPYAYNESIAQEHFPLTQEQVLANGWNWKEKIAKEYQSQTYLVPKQIIDVADDICDAILGCEDCAKNYRIVKSELAFYRQMSLPIPSKCHDCRHHVRNMRKNPRKLYPDNCANCKKALQTTYAPSKPEVIFCEDCYLKAVY